MDANERVSFHLFDQFRPTLEQLDSPNSSVNIDLDVWGNIHWAIWDGKTMKLGNYNDL